MQVSADGSCPNPVGDSNVCSHLARARVHLRYQRSKPAALEGGNDNPVDDSVWLKSALFLSDHGFHRPRKLWAFVSESHSVGVKLYGCLPTFAWGGREAIWVLVKCHDFSQSNVGSITFRIPCSYCGACHGADAQKCQNNYSSCSRLVMYCSSHYLISLQSNHMRRVPSVFLVQGMVGSILRWSQDSSPITRYLYSFSAWAWVGSMNMMGCHSWLCYIMAKMKEFCRCSWGL